MSPLEHIEEFSDRAFPHLREKNVVLWILWREVMHVTSSLVLIVVSHALYVRGFERAPYIILILLIIFITWKEFYRDIRLYKQKLYKSFPDWIAWIAPFVAYLIFWI